jgi:hypothetical protein
MLKLETRLFFRLYEKLTDLFVKEIDQLKYTAAENNDVKRSYYFFPKALVIFCLINRISC